jgi:hypothetical protein
MGLSGLQLPPSAEQRAGPRVTPGGLLFWLEQNSFFWSSSWGNGQGGEEEPSNPSAQASGCLLDVVLSEAGPRRGCWVVFVFSEGRVRAGVCTLRSTSTFRPELE